VPHVNSAVVLMTNTHTHRYRNHGLGLADLGEARRVVISHAEHEAKERALHQFRLFRPPNVEALAKSPFFEPPESDATKAKRHERFAPVTNLLYAEGIEARKYRLRRLGFSHSLYTPKTTLDDLPVSFFVAPFEMSVNFVG